MALTDWCPTPEEIEIYEEWVIHERYPYAGGFLDQPIWFRELRRKCGLLDEWHRLNEGLKEAK